VKADCQIVAIAAAASCREIWTHDGHLGSIAGTLVIVKDLAKETPPIHGELDF
jgi:hypothetical protein